MTAWKTMESAPKDGTEVLLVARFQIYGGDGTDLSDSWGLE